MRRKRTKHYTYHREGAHAPRLQVPRQRLILLVGTWAVLLVAIAIRLIYVQVLGKGIEKNKQVAKLLKSYQEKIKEAPARRGSILDRNGQVIAQDLLQYDLALRVQKNVDYRPLAAVLAKYLNKSRTYYLKRIQQYTGRYVQLGWRIPRHIKEAIEAEVKLALSWTPRFSRFYPFKSLASQVVGYCNYDENEAPYGLERQYEEYLKGRPGQKVVIYDARRKAFPLIEFSRRLPVDGLDVQTTLDMTFQQIMELELEAGVKRHQAKGGTAILMNPRTGEILAMANYPHFDPNNYGNYPVNSFKNLAIAQLYDPGSTFKAVALSYILNYRLYSLDNTRVNCEKGLFRYRRIKFQDHEPFGVLTVREVFAHSSNIGVVKLSRRFERQKFYRLVRNFGFGMVTGIDLPEEERGILRRPSEFSRVTIPFMSIGYEILVTPLQILNMYAAIANGGKLMQPYIVQRVVSKTGDVVLENQPVVIRQVIPSDVAAKVTSVLQDVVEHGTGVKARIDGIRIAGKTGTAQQYNPKVRSYRTGRYVASFVGFFPAENPEFAMIVVVFEPKKGYYGGQVAAPIFRNIAYQIYSLREARPQQAHQEIQEPVVDNSLPVVPHVEGMNDRLAISILKKNGFAVKRIGNGNRVWRQEVLEYDAQGNPQKIAIYLQTELPVTEKLADYPG